MSETTPPLTPTPPSAEPAEPVASAEPTRPAQSPEQLRAELERLRLLADSVPVGVAYYQRDGNLCLLANRMYARMFGHDERSVLGLPVEQVIGDEAARNIRPKVEAMFADHRTARYARVLPGTPGPDGAPGEPTFIEVSLIPHTDNTPGGSGEGIGAFVLITDISRHHRAEDALRKSEERLTKFMQASAEGIVFHKGGFITDVNPPLLRMLGYTLEQMMGRRTLDFVAPEERAKVAAVIAAGTEITYDSVAMHQDGHAVPVEFIVRTMQHQDSQQRMTIVRDRRDRVAAEARIYQLAHHDALTGLPNRALFDQRVEHLVAASALRRRGDAASGFALLFIDLDHFKRVNDSLGHVVGDALLQTVARRIAATLRIDDLVARFGGDEFAVVLGGSPSREAVLEVANKLLAVVSEAVQVLGSDISVTPSIGIALHPEHGYSATELVKNADTAMYEAKRQGRATCRFFEPRMAELAYAELAMEVQLAQAIREGEFELHYQPQLTLDANGGQQLVGVEALIRWRHPQRGLVLPQAFLHVAEVRRQIVPIAHWVLAESLRQAMAWRRAGWLNVPLAVNLAMLQFQAPGFVDGVRQALFEAGSEGAHLELELTERMLMEDLPAVQHTLRQLRAMGVLLAIDDFGTGYSSLAHLRELPIQRLKIDRSFIAEAPHERSAAAISRAIIQLGHSLGLRVVAEGVENAAQRDWCMANGCHELQGYLLGAPMAADVFEAWLRALPGTRTP